MKNYVIIIEALRFCRTFIYEVHIVSVHGYYDGTAYVATETVNPYKNQGVIITLLDEPQPVRKPVTLEKLESFASNAADAQNYISKMRADRVF